MKVGDLVMFKPEGRYAAWFGGKMAIIESVSNHSTPHVAVRWLQPVKYFDSWATISHFALDRFYPVAQNG